jgi:hypothetical protein
MTTPTNPQTPDGVVAPIAPTIGEVFDIPRQVHQGDFVLKLTEGVDERHAAATLRDYVVTPQLIECFKESLGLIRGALDAGASRGAYLHGSFGAGKSHFMAVLTLLLNGDTRARAVPELAPLVSDNRDWLGHRKVLVVPMHLINAVSLESAVLGQYARYVRERHPDAPTPGFYRSDRLFADARSLRATIGDRAFFAKLRETSSGAVGWGALGSGWDADSFDIALDAQPGDPERARLVSDLVDAFFSNAASLATSHEGGFVPLDEGMVILTQHAKSLGYDGVVLFLDEVMLWLASNAANPSFLTAEAQKLVALVETANMRRAIPVVSFLARQRDLRELVGEHLAGAEQQAIDDVLRYWEGRFATIRLEDRNLPAIIEKRLLRPVSETARAQIEEAHARTEQIRAEVMSVLLTREGDRQQFKQVYPFSPVLVQALVALSSLLQRERTALKLLVQLLSNQRDTLRLGDIMPVGELWSVIADGTEQPFSAAVRERFEQARRLWRTKLLPLLEEEKQGAIGGGITSDAADTLYRNDLRLMATLILAALAEGVEALDELTPQKLAALNHGTIRSRIPGQEARAVLDKLRRWAGRVGEIRIAENGATPTVSLHLVGVDTEVIVENARAADSMGARVQKVRVLLFEMANIPSEDALVLPVRSLMWRGTARNVEILFNNVRTMAPEQFLPSGQAPWRLVIDYPFDEPGQTPVNDRAAVQQARANGQEGPSIIWLPSFLTPSAQDELGKLVVLDFLLSGNQLDAHAAHLSALDRAQAKELLVNQRTAVRANVQNALLAAYAVTSQFREKVDDSHGLDTHLYTLATGLTLQPPVGATFRDALDHVVGQALSWQFPAHPAFETEVRPATLKKVWGWVQKATQQPNSRVEVDTAADRLDMKRVAVPLGLGQMGDAHFVLERSWESHFAQCQARDGVAQLTVQRVRQWIDQPRARGLPREAQNLVILTWALQTDRSFHLYGSSAPVDGTIDRLQDELEVRTQQLPDEASWSTATQRAGSLFGLAIPALRSAQALAMLARAVEEKARGAQSDVTQYVQRLDGALGRLQIDGASSDRRSTAQAARDLLTSILGQRPEGVVRALAEARIPTSPTAMSEALTHGMSLAQALELVQWPLVQNLSTLPSESFGVRVDALLEGLRDVLRRDEYVLALRPAVEGFNDEGMRLLSESARLMAEEQSRARAIEATRRQQEDEERRKKEAVLDALREQERAKEVVRLRQLEAALQEQQRLVEEARQRELEYKREEARKNVKEPKAPKSLTVAGSEIDSALTKIREDVSSSGDADVEISWRIHPRTNE